LIFLIDENLSPKLVGLHGDIHKAIHINQLKPHKKATIKDDLIRKLSLNQSFVLVTKDDDFVKSWVDRKVPEKLIYVYDNFDGLDQLMESYHKSIPRLEAMIIEYDFLEFSNQGIRTPFDGDLPYQQQE
jgi:predicted nuclease of predicted toxin-antitoxin system